MKLDKDVRKLAAEDARKELLRAEHEVLLHRHRQPCRHSDQILYDAVLPEGSNGMGRMDTPKEILLRNCGTYYDRLCQSAPKVKTREYHGDVYLMTPGKVRQEIMRVRLLVRNHKKKQENARCWVNDRILHNKVLPLQSLVPRMEHLGKSSARVFCEGYINGQQCDTKLCPLVRPVV